MDRPQSTVRSASFRSSLYFSRPPTQVAAAIHNPRCERAQGGLRRSDYTGPRRGRAGGASCAIVLLGTLLAGGTWSTPASASDGVLEINQTCAVQTGCFAGDTPGLPVTISASGSYRLTSNLVVPDENTDGIVVSTDDVGIDLNNFSILGPVVCSGTTLACTPSSGTGSGVERTATLLSGISVRNGSIRGMGSYGVLLGVQSEVMNVRVRSNRSFGIFADSGSTVSGNSAYQNGGTGIFASSGSTVSGNTAYQNIGDGIQTAAGATVLGNTIHSNTGFGLNLGGLSGYRENVIT